MESTSNALTGLATATSDGQEKPWRLPLDTRWTVLLPAPFTFSLLNRALVYALLLLGIFVLYLGSFLLLFRLLSGDFLLQAILIAGLTLLVSLSFDWVRTHVQRLVDRLFYGGWYDYPGVVEMVSDALARCIERTQLTHVLTEQVPSLMQLYEGRLWIG